MTDDPVVKLDEENQKLAQELHASGREIDPGQVANLKVDILVGLLTGEATRHLYNLQFATQINKILKDATSKLAVPTGQLHLPGRSNG